MTTKINEKIIPKVEKKKKPKQIKELRIRTTSDSKLEQELWLKNQFLSQKVKNKYKRNYMNIEIPKGCKTMI